MTRYFLFTFVFLGVVARLHAQQGTPADDTTQVSPSAPPTITPAAKTSSPTPSPYDQPIPGVQPAPGTQMAPGLQPTPGTEAARPQKRVVHSTGGIINDQPEDIFNRAGSSVDPAPRDATPAPAPAPIPASNLSELNQTADSISYSNRGHGPFRLSVEQSGVWSNNIFNAPSQRISSGFVDLAIPVGIQIERERTNFGIYYRPNFTFYPAYSELNHVSHIYTQQLDHRVSDLTDFTWNLAGGRVVTFGQYLPSIINVGTIGVVQAVSPNNLEYTYNAATSFGLTHRLSERNAVTTSLTAGWLEQPLSDGTATQPRTVNRSEVGGMDVHFTRTVTPRTLVGVELNDIYVRGLSPVGHSNFAALKGTFTTMFSEHGSIVLGAGPLYGNTVLRSGAAFELPTGSNLSYTANAGVIYQTSYAKLSAGYERSLEIGYIGTPLPSHDFYGVFDRPLTRTMDLVADTRYTRTATGVGAGVLGSGAEKFSTLGLTTRLSSYITPNISYFIGASYFRQSAPGTVFDGFSRADFTAGLSYSFGRPLDRIGAR